MLRHLVEGCSLRGTARLTGVSYGAVSKTLREAGPLAAAFHGAHVRGVAPKRVQLDEIWNYIGAKRKNAPKAKVAESGDFWLWTAICPDTKLLISFLLGGRNARMARGIIEDLKSRVETFPDICTDGYPAYEEAIYDVFEGRAAHTELVFNEKRVTHGDPDLALQGTSFVERLNLTLRMEIRRYMRKTNAFSKSTERHAEHVALWALYYNWVRKHRTLKTTPAVAAGLSPYVQPMDWIARMLEAGHETAKDVADRFKFSERYRERAAAVQRGLDTLAALESLQDVELGAGDPGDWEPDWP